MPTAIKRREIIFTFGGHIHNSNTSLAPQKKLIAECTNRILSRRSIKQNSDQNISRSVMESALLLPGGVKFYLFSERYDKSVNMLCKFVKYRVGTHRERISSEVLLNKSRDRVGNGFLKQRVFNCRSCLSAAA